MGSILQSLITDVNRKALQVALETDKVNNQSNDGEGLGRDLAPTHQVLLFDNPTADLMADFYAGLQNGQGRAAALRAAQMNMLERGPEFGDPAAWAAFTIIGDWR